jgi:hypothetical protein
VEIVLSRNHIKVWMPQFGLVWVDDAIPTLPFSEGVVSFGHHNYGAEKAGEENTWHWDEVSISPAVPFTILQLNRRGVSYNDSPGARTFALPEPAPENAVLRFAAVGESVRVAFDGGPFRAAPLAGEHDAPEHPASYLVPVPAGTKSVAFDIDPAYGNHGEIQNPAVFARTLPPADATGLLFGSPPARGAIGLLVVARNADVGALTDSLGTAGCPVEVLAVLQNGSWRVNIPAAPAAVNVGFPASLAANTPVFVRCAR